MLERRTAHYDLLPGGWASGLGSGFGVFVGSCFAGTSGLNLLGLLEVNGEMRTPFSWIALPVGAVAVFVCLRQPRSLDVMMDGHLRLNRLIGARVIQPVDVVSMKTKWDTGYDDVYLSVVLTRRRGKVSIREFKGAEEVFTRFARRNRRIDTSELDFSLPKPAKRK